MYICISIYAYIYLSIVPRVQQTTRTTGHSTNRKKKKRFMYTYTNRYAYVCISKYAYVYLLIVPGVQQTKERLHTALTNKNTICIYIYTLMYI